MWGIDPRTRAARVLVEADYRMKLVGMGLEEGVLGVPSYLEEVKRVGGDPPSMNVLRWWFTLNYEGIRATAARDAFQLEGPGVKVLSENELLSETGDRIHTGKSDELTSGFARSFTKHFDALAAKYPIYAELKNIFDLALVAGLIQSHDVPAQVGWHMTFLADPDGYRVALGPQPKEVESVVNSVTVNKSRFFAGVSGGVSVDTSALVDAGGRPGGRLRSDGRRARFGHPAGRQLATRRLVVGLVSRLSAAARIADWRLGRPAFPGPHPDRTRSSAAESSQVPAGLRSAPGVSSFRSASQTDLSLTSQATTRAGVSSKSAMIES